MLLEWEQCHGNCVVDDNFGSNPRSNSRQALSATQPPALINKHMPSFLMPMRAKAEEGAGGEDDGKAGELVSQQPPMDVNYLVIVLCGIGGGSDI